MARPGRLAITLALLALTPLLAGCIGQETTPQAPATSGPEVEPFPLQLVEARGADGETLWYASTNLSGALPAADGPNVTERILWQDGTPYRIGTDGDLRPAQDLLGEAPPVTLSDRIAFQNSRFPVQLGTTCLEKTDGDAGCGLDEPSVRVDGRGWIYYTAVCCFVEDSPIWVSKDRGETFQRLGHPVKDLYGNEGTITLDSAGNLYYMDIDLATFGFARWTPELEPSHAYRRTGELVIDRPWIRATDDGIVHAIYNTGGNTVAYRSTDHGLTFSATPVARFGSALALGYSDARHDVVGMVGDGHYMESRDNGETWSERQPVQGCQRAGFLQVESADVDAAGTVWHQLRGCVVGRQNGTWTESSQAIPGGIEPFFTWVAAGAEDSVAVGMYGRVTDAQKAEALGVETDGWYLFVSFTVDGGEHWATVLADDDAVGYGSLGRRLGDFLQVDVGPDGSIHFAYARNPEMDDSATAVYRRTSPIPGMAPPEPLVGPLSPS